MIIGKRLRRRSGRHHGQGTFAFPSEGVPWRHEIGSEKSRGILRILTPPSNVCLPLQQAATVARSFKRQDERVAYVQVLSLLV